MRSRSRRLMPSIPAVWRAAGELGRPVIVSTGACEMAELTAVVAWLRGLPDALSLRSSASASGALMHCVSAYPTPVEQAALHGIAALRERFGLPTGYSDHTTSIHTGGWAVAAGALLLEKHLTHDRAAAGPDHAASLEPDAFAAYVQHARAAAVAMGATGKRVQPIEADVRRVARQSVAAARDLSAGRVLVREDLTVMRPGTGIPAARLDRLVGHTLRRAVAVGNLIEPDVVPGLTSAADVAGLGGGI